MSDITDQIKERISVAELVGQYLKLDNAGTNYKALCPFHNEKSPSFMVNPERNFWYCFGCQKGGDIFSFVMEMEGIDFRAALERLAERAGVEIPVYNRGQKESGSKKKRLFDLLLLATKYYQLSLAKTERGREAMKYLESRKILGREIELFKIGYAPQGWSNILDYLKGKGFKIDEIEAAGLIIRKENSTSSYYDRFRDRIMFPVIDISGQVVGYSARVMKGADEKSAKYINTPATAVYDKSSVLYGLFQSKTEIKRKDYVIIVEGNADVIASHMGGVRNVAAVSGTALTGKQVGILRRYTNNFKLCFDMDQAGQNATAKSIQTCLKEGADVEIIMLGNGIKDVNDLVVEDPSAWKSAVERSRSVMEYFFKSVSDRYDMKKVKEKKIAAQKLLNIINDIADPIEQSYWIRKASDLLEVDEEVLTKVLEKVKLKKAVTTSGEENQSGRKILNSKPRKLVLEERLLGLYSLCQDELGKKAAKMDLSLLSKENGNYFQKIRSGDVGDIEGKLNELILPIKYHFDDKEGFIENDVVAEKEWNLIIDQLKKEKKKESVKKIVWDIRKAEGQGDSESVEILLKELESLTKEVN